MNEFDYNRPRGGDLSSRKGEGAVIDPAGTLTKIYLNCNTTAEEVATAFGAIPEDQFTSSGWGALIDKYFAFCAGTYTEQQLKAYSSIMIENAGAGQWMVSFLDYDENRKDYYFIPEAIPESPISEPGWYDGSTYEKLTGVIEFVDANPQPGQLEFGSYTAGQSNDLLTKIFSFNRPFSSAAEDHELSYTNRDGIVDKDFRYDRPKTGGYPFTNVDGPTPADSTKFLNWTRRDDAVPSGPGAIIKPTEVLSKLYLNCDSSAEDVEEAFENLTYITVEGTDGYYAYAIEEIEDFGVTGLSIIRTSGDADYQIMFVSDITSRPYFFRYNETDEAWEKGSIGATGIDWEETSGIQTIELETSVGPGMAQLTDGTVVGSANDKLTKILSFNEPFNN